ncbi:MAG TPA: LON peptidase substrate-binding domain-containing protein [Candidatus Sulfotelmatobacter sp.]|jgi:Lon protease-like protein|nr:LON peptidase substrate-binding domain-containing protein [Candidatus Sulfotelmatobacter sp.]
MEERPFHPRLEDLPQILPIFPLPGVLLLPEGRLPLNIFEPRYLAMVQDALGWGRLIGMIQPSNPEPAKGAEPHLFETGCAGRISSFSETEDGRILLTLTGVCRFRILREVESLRGYRRVAADWGRFRDDLTLPPEPEIDRSRLLGVLKAYLKLQNIELNWNAIESAGNLALTVSLPMALPFEPREKQAMLEAVTPAQRGETLLALLEMAVAEATGGLSIIKQ